MDTWTHHHSSHFGCEQPLMAPATCRRILAEELADGWPTLADALAVTYGPGWRLHADAAATGLLDSGHLQHGHDGTELALVRERPWQTTVATFDDGRIVSFVAETATTVANRANRSGLAGAGAPPGFWGGPSTSVVGPLGVTLRDAANWVVVDHAGTRILAASGQLPQSGTCPSDHAGDEADPPYVLVHQPVARGVLPPVGCRCAGLAWDLTLRHPLLSITPPSDPVLRAATRGTTAAPRRVA
jgi:hypothetical protein